MSIKETLEEFIKNPLAWLTALGGFGAYVLGTRQRSAITDKTIVEKNATEIDVIAKTDQLREEKFKQFNEMFEQIRKEKDEVSKEKEALLIQQNRYLEKVRVLEQKIQELTAELTLYRTISGNM